MKIKQFIFFLLFFIFCKKSFSQTYSSTIDDKEIIQFMNWLIKTDKKENDDFKLRRKRIANSIMRWDSVNFISKKKSPSDKFIDEYYYIYKNKFVDTTFKQADKDFIFKQFTSIKDSIWHQKFGNSKLINPDRQKRPRRYYYTLPLFSVDKKIVVIKKEFYCGNLCAYGGTYIYKKVRNKWYLFAGFDKWIS